MKPHYYLKKLLLLLTMIQPVYLSANEIRAIDSVEALSSPQLVAAVLHANPKLEVAQATWQASVAKIAQQSALDDPQFQYSFAPLTVNSQKMDGQTLDFGQRFEISQNIPFPGKLHLHGKVAEYQAETQWQSIIALQLLLATQTKFLFADWYFIHQAIAINKTNQTLLAEFRDIAVTRYSTGRASKQDILRAEVEQALLKHQAIVLQRERKIILAQLNTLLNRPVETALPLPQQLTEISELPGFEQLQVKALQSRPELKASMANINAHKIRTDLAALNYYPDLKLSAGYNSLWDNEDKRFNLGVSINIPLDQSKRQAAEQEAKANSQQAHWQKIDLEAKISEELSIAYAQVEESLHVLQLYRQQLSPLADDNMAAAKADYQAGKGDFLTLISSEKNRLQTQLQAEQALTDLHHRLAKLEQTVGSLQPFLTEKTGSQAP
ncbi:MAG: TolC family protein [Methylococcaceae bacterium]|nr:TolC family protein [Methylococcaceae bacterium]